MSGDEDTETWRKRQVHIHDMANLDQVIMTLKELIASKAFESFAEDDQTRITAMLRKYMARERLAKEAQ